MVRSLSVGLALILGGLLVAQRGAGNETAIEGTWELVSVERDGKEMKVHKDTKLIVEGDKFVIMVGDKTVAGGTSKFDPSKKPNAVDSTYTEGPDKGKSFKGIYQLDGDMVKFCRASGPDKERPTEFKTTQEGGGFLAVYKRVKP
jgi:uncharacterized protein (TIGR03067 family)